MFDLRFTIAVRILSIEVDHYGLTRFSEFHQQKYAWSLFGVVLAVLFGGLTVYSEFVRDRRAKLRFEVVSNTGVLDVREELSKLEILYDGIDIVKFKQSLRVVVVRVVNFGESDILIDHYDKSVPLGFLVSKGELLRVEPLEASNRYLSSNLHVSVTDSVRGVFEPIILESKEFFAFKALILHEQGTPPTLSPQGKIAGIRTIDLTEQSSTKSEKSYWHTVFAGGVWVQAARLVTYFVGLILLAVAVISPVVYFSGRLTRTRRTKHIRHFRKVTDIELQDKDEFLFSAYENNGRYYVKALTELLSDKNELKKAIDELGELGEESKQFHVGVGTTDIPPIVMREQAFGVRALLQNNVIQQTGDSWEEDAHVVHTILEFERFLRIIRAAD